MGRATTTALLLAAALCVGGKALAAESDADAPVATANAAAAAPSVAEQIDTYLKTSPAVGLPKDAALGVTPAEEPRKVHGVVDVSVGTGGYRSAYVQADVPVGKSGTLSLAASEVRMDGRRFRGFGGPYGAGLGPLDRQSLGIGLALGGASAADPAANRCGPMAWGEYRPRPADPSQADEHLRPCPLGQAAPW